MAIDSLTRLRKISAAGKPVRVILKIKASPADSGLSLLDLLSALELIRHSSCITLTHLCCKKTRTSEFRQAMFQVRYYFPAVKVK